MALNYEHQWRNIWLGLAQGPLGGWTNEAEPPTPSLIPQGSDPTGKGLTNLLGVKHVKNVSLVVPLIGHQHDTGGLQPPKATPSVINYKGQQWQPVSDQDAMKYGARWVYYEADIEPEDLPYGQFRQTGLYYGLQPKPEYADAKTSQVIDQAYKPEQLEPKQGYLIAYDDQLVQGYYSNTHLVENIVSEF